MTTIPNVSVTGLSGFVIASKILDALVAKGLLSPADAKAIFTDAAKELGDDARSACKDAAAYMAQEARQR